MIRLTRLVPLCQADNGRSDQLPETALRRILVDLGMRPDEDSRDAEAVEEFVSELRLPGGGGAGGGGAGGGGAVSPDGSLTVSSDAFCELMRTQTFLRGESGRYWVVLSLREAESLRGCLHLAMDQVMIPNDPMMTSDDRLMIL
jgi:hypothetical protein